MHFKPVLVSLKATEDDKTYSTSGLLYNTDMVLITGTSLIPFVEKEKWISLFIKSCSAECRNNEYIKNCSFRVFVEFIKKHKSETEKVYKKICKLKSTPLGVWKCPLISKSIRNLFYDWSFGCMNSENESKISLSDHIHLCQELMSVFILLKCESEKNLERTRIDDNIYALSDFVLNLKKPKRGQEVDILSTPFGIKFFMNSLSRGVISNVVGCKKCIILSDARTVSGCEGGPIFVRLKSWKQEKKRVLVGIVAASLSWWKDEWVGLTVGISLLPVLTRLYGQEDKIRSEGVVENVLCSYNADLSTVDFIDDTVVFIRSKASWGAGVILNAASGIIITCSHVIKNNDLVSVFQKGNHYLAKVIYKTQKDVAYDLAVIKTKKFLFSNEANFSKNPPKLGEAVIAAGFPFFSETDDVHIRPSVASGCIAQVNPHMIQTTCCIQSGFSGGPLYRNKELLGIIISNVKDSTVGTLFPHINFVVPSSAFKEPILKYIKTGNAECLKDLECSDTKVQALWKLQTSKL